MFGRILVLQLVYPLYVDCFRVHCRLAGTLSIFITLTRALTFSQRVRTLTEFRTMSVAPYPIQCYRDKKWVKIQTDALLPGDIVSVGA